jgi:D-lactate dehydrogenase
MNIALFSTQPYDRTFFDEENGDGRHQVHYFEPSLTAETRLLAEGFPAICVFVNDKLEARTIAHLAERGLKLIALRCAGFNNVDLAAAEQHGVCVVRVPAYSPYAVAEHAVALILTLNRKTHKAFNRVREGNFSLVRLEGFDLHGRTVGVIGTGKIGQVFCRIMQGFGCEVIAYDLYPNEEVTASGVKYVGLEALFAQADIISLHCPLTPDTHHLIDAEALAQMKDGVMLINTSRGALVDAEAVVSALKHRKVGYLGIDVYEQEEKLFFRDLSETVIEDDTIARLMSFSNVLVTAHQAFFTQNALTQIAQTTLRNVDAFVAGEELVNQVKP